MRLKEIIGKIESDFPLKLAYSWDNCGLLIGDADSDIKKVMTCLEANELIVEEAVKNNVDLIVTHHPFLFKGLKKINRSDYKGNLVYRLIENKISIYSMHTNFDIGKNGLNDRIMDMIGAKDSKILDVTASEQLMKYCVYVPVEDANKVREAMFKANPFKMGNYENTSFNIEGRGSFKPTEGANPHIGESGKQEYVKEIKIETICKKGDVNRLIQAVNKAHPYEEVAFDLIALENKGEKNGLGRIGKLDQAMDLKSFAMKLKSDFKVDSVRVVGPLDRQIKKVAVVSGSGSEYVRTAKSMGADVFITGDVKYHEAQDTVDMDMCMIDLGHYGSEKIFSKIMKEYFDANLDVDAVETSCDIDPFVNI